VLLDGDLSGVLVRMDDPGHGPLQGHWSFEGGFGRFFGFERVFPSPQVALVSLEFVLARQVR
jgi:hypothetical protein